MKTRILLCMAVSLMLTLFSCHKTEKVQVYDLKVESLVNPLGLEQKQPRLSWKLHSEERGVHQQAYRIIVSSSEEKLKENVGDLWDSGRIPSSETVLIPYEGAPLSGRQFCYWKVRIETNLGEVVSSERAFWSMGLEASDWQAKWIGLESIEAEGEDRKMNFVPENEDELRLKSETRLRARYLRKVIKLGKDVKSAMLYISGLGLYEAYLNGHKIGDQVLAPTPTDYSKTVPYNTFDVTSYLNKGENTIGVILGNGRFFSMRIPWFRTFGLPQLLSQLEVTYKDDTKDTFVSDESWKVTLDGPLGVNNEFDGEEYDARKEMEGWSTNDFDDAAWYSVELVNAPEGKLQAQENPNIKVMEHIKPLSVHKLGDDKYIVDMGQNMVGWMTLKVRGKQGDKVTLRYAELLKEDGHLYLDNLRGAKVTDTYILKGDEEETWEPKFVFHGFRYVEVSGFPGVPTVDHFEGRVVYDEMKTTGTFETSNAIINRIYQNACWGIKGNYRGMPTDCPQRDERMGWLGDRTTGAYGESYIYDNQKLYAKWLKDIEDSQLANGALPDVAPNYWEMYTNDVTWPAAYFTVADMLYKQYGDVRPIIRHYDSFKAFIQFIRDNYLKDDIVIHDTFGDWCMPPESMEMIHSQDPSRKTSGELLSTAYYYRLLVLMRKFASLSGNDKDIAYYRESGDRILKAFNRKFYNASTGYYSNNTVTANLLALMNGMAPDSVRQVVFEHVVDKTLNEFKGHVSTGLIGIQWLMRGLSDYGQPELAYKIATNKTYPSWGYMIENDATTIWELWNGNTADPAMNSANHVMLLGDLIIWYYEYLAGIRNEAASTGFKKIEMKPLLVGDLTYVNASYQSIRGEIRSHWRREGTTFIWDIAIPANTTASVYLLEAVGKEIKEGNKELNDIKSITGVRTDGNWVIIDLESGEYSFTVKQNRMLN